MAQNGLLNFFLFHSVLLRSIVFFTRMEYHASLFIISSILFFLAVFFLIRSDIIGVPFSFRFHFFLPCGLLIRQFFFVFCPSSAFDMPSLCQIISRYSWAGRPQISLRLYFLSHRSFPIFISSRTTIRFSSGFSYIFVFFNYALR